MLGVGAVDGFGLVTKVGHGESFGVAATLGALRPRVTVGVESQAFDVESVATLLEFRGTITGTNLR